MNDIKKNFLYNIFYQLLIIFLPLITAPYISRTLGANSLGIYSYSNSVAYYFLLIAMLGIGNHGNRSIASVRDDNDKLNEKFNSIYSLQVLLYVISIFLYVLYVIFFVQNHKLIFILQIFYVTSGLFDISWLFFGLEKFKITVTRNTLIKILTVIFIFIFVKNPDDLWKYTLIMSLGTFLSQTYLIFIAKKYVKFRFVNIEVIGENIKPVIILFIPVLAYSIYKVMDKIMLGNMATYYEVGFYQNAEKIINIPMGIINAVGTVMLPRMSNLIANNNEEKAMKYIRYSFKLVTIIASLIAFGLMGISDIFAPVYFGIEFKSCSVLIELLSITVFFVSWANVIRTQYLIPKHYDKVYIISTIVGAFVNLIANVLLIPLYFGVGAAIGTILAEFSVMIIQVLYINKKIHFIKYILNYLPVLFIGFIMMAVVKYVGIFGGQHVYTLLLQIAIGGLIYIILILIYFILSKDEIGIYIKNEILKSKKLK